MWPRTQLATTTGIVGFSSSKQNNSVEIARNHVMVNICRNVTLEAPIGNNLYGIMWVVPSSRAGRRKCTEINLPQYKPVVDAEYCCAPC
ncbi:hypothetical protein AVEN_70595-1 [Araneus ventricosus]|uniref:Uncharacterized protein n=1 Tax=Araneus ventricosus TaxID=182803 RepID=A0A4Y2CH22_ARAVE|nr:hypothetical protein AVEN_70595-1 [Araneus ventricosus]